MGVGHIGLSKETGFAEGAWLHGSLKAVSIGSRHSHASGTNGGVPPDVERKQGFVAVTKDAVLRSSQQEECICESG